MMLHHFLKSAGRRRNSSPVAAETILLENRIVLSATPAAATAADFTGHWALQFTGSTGSTVEIDQTGGQAHANFVLKTATNIYNFEFLNKAPHGTVLKLKAKGEFNGEPAKARVKLQLSDETHFSGPFKGKVQGQAINLALTGTKT